MATREWTERDVDCVQCGEKVIVYWSHITQKNAAGETVVDDKRGVDAAKHEFR